MQFEIRVTLKGDLEMKSLRKLKNGIIDPE